MLRILAIALLLAAGCGKKTSSTPVNKPTGGEPAGSGSAAKADDCGGSGTCMTLECGDKQGADADACNKQCHEKHPDCKE